MYILLHNNNFLRDHLIIHTTLYTNCNNNKIKIKFEIDCLKYMINDIHQIFINNFSKSFTFYFNCVYKYIIRYLPTVKMIFFFFDGLENILLSLANLRLLYVWCTFSS